MVETQIMGLATGEKGFKLDTGELVGVRFVQPTTLPAGVVAITIVARLVDTSGATVVLNGQRVEMPGHTVTMMVEQMGASPASSLPHIALIMEQEAQKVRGFASALRSISTLSISKE